jgi:hypothetical protein
VAQIGSGQGKRVGEEQIAHGQWGQEDQDPMCRIPAVGW